MRKGMLPKVSENLVQGPSHNEDVRRKIQAATGKYDELQTLGKKRKLRWFGLTSRSKTILQDTVNERKLTFSAALILSVEEWQLYAVIMLILVYLQEFPRHKSISEDAGLKD